MAEFKVLLKEMVRMQVMLLQSKEHVRRMLLSVMLEHQASQLELTSQQRTYQHL